MCKSDIAESSILGKRLNRSQGINPAKISGISTTICKCGVCNLIFSNPQPIPNDIHDHYGIDPSDYWKENYFKVDEKYFTGEIHWLKTLLEVKKGMKALDIGAGIGKGMISMQKKGFDTYGIEPSVQFYDLAVNKMNIDPQKISNVKIEDASFPENFFDFITFSAVLEHLYDPSQAIIKALKWLKDDGIIHIEVPNSKWLIAKILNLSYKIRGLDYVTNLSPMHPPYHLFEFSLNSFLIHGQQNKYEVIDHGYYVAKTFLPKVFDFFIKPYMKKTNTGMQLVVWLKKIK